MAKPTQSEKQQVNKDSEFETVEDTYAEPWKDMDVGDTLEGKYLGFREVRGDGKRLFPTYVIQLVDGTLRSVAGGTLEGRMYRIPEGTKVRVTFKGTQTHKGNEMKLFDVDMAKGTKLLPISFKRNARPMTESGYEGGDSDIPF